MDKKEKIDIDEIFIILRRIVNIIKGEKKGTLIDFENIFQNILKYYSNEDLNELCKLHNLVRLLNINSKLKEKFYYILHEKGINLIKNGKLEIQAIIFFITCQDIFYFDQRYKNNEKRDPIVFKYIPITNTNKEYLNNIKLIKDCELYRLFIDSSHDLKKKFYNILLDQM